MARMGKGSNPADVPAREPSREVNLATGQAGVAIPRKGVYDPRSMQTSNGRPFQIDEQRHGLRELSDEELAAALNPAGISEPPTILDDLPMNEPLPAPTTVGEIQRGASPPDPETAQRLLELQSRVEELVASYQAERERNDDLRFQMEAFGNGARVAAPTQVPTQAPNGVSLDTPATLGDFYKFAENMIKILPAHSIRAQWDISSDEEMNVYREYPQAQTLDEPYRTQFVQRAVQRTRERAARAKEGTKPAATTQAVSRVSSPIAQRTVASTVPLVESGSAAAAGVAEPQNRNLLSEAIQQYKQAQTIRNPRERNEALRTAADRIAKLQGMDNRGDFGRGGFVQQTRSSSR